MKPSRDLDELCYSYIYDTTWLCDYEVATDELCGHVGMSYELLKNEMPDLASDLDRLQPLIFHANGSVRGQIAITEDDIALLKDCLNRYRQEVQGLVRGFVLPRGALPIPYLHLGRSAAKKSIRALVRLEQEGKEIPQIVSRFCNIVCNLLFAMTLVINHRRHLTEVPFESLSYKVKKPVV
jgi:ATP:cob(I)alamin adenosyltransferase